MKRAKYFITCKGKYFDKVYKFNQNFIETNLVYQEKVDNNRKLNYEQLSLFNNNLNSYSNMTNEKTLLFNKLQPTKEDKINV